MGDFSLDFFTVDEFGLDSVDIGDLSFDFFVDDFDLDSVDIGDLSFDLSFDLLILGD